MNDFKPFIISLTVIILLWISSFFVLPLIEPLISERGLLGDSFGALNALFSGLAFAGIIATIIMQRNELQLQRKELALTRKELSKSAEAQEASQEALHHQVNLMTKQAVLTAYQASYSGNIDLLASKVNIIGDPKARQRAHDQNVELKKKIDNLILGFESDFRMGFYNDIHNGRNL